MGYVSKTTFVIDHLPDIQFRATCVIYYRQLLFQFVIVNLFTSSIPGDKVRLFGTWFKFLIQQLRPEWIIILKRMLFDSSLL